LLQRHPTWRQEPVAVVAEDRPHGTILWVNNQARRTGITPGLRYATGLALLPTLRAGVVSPAARMASVERLRAAPHACTPGVEASDSEPGLFWLDATGVSPSDGPVQVWAHAVATALQQTGFQATVAVGFSRGGVTVVAKVQRGVVVFADAS